MFEKIFSWLTRGSPISKQPVPRDKEMVSKLMSMLNNTHEMEFSCDEVFELLDQYAEQIINGENAGQFMSLIKHHLDMCKDCSEEYESLISILNAELA